MNIDIPVIVVFSVLAIALVVFLVKRNRKDKKNLVNKLNDDYKKPPENDI